jgi:hypothetical protein
MPIRWSDAPPSDQPRWRRAIIPLLPLVMVVALVRDNRASRPGDAIRDVHAADARTAAEGVAIDTSSTETSSIDGDARELVRIALAFAQHAPDEVDSYFGPASLGPVANAAKIPLADLSRRAHRLLDRLGAEQRNPSDRTPRLIAETRALAAVIDQRASGKRMSFDDEARIVYAMSVEPGSGDADAVTGSLAALDRALPGSGPLPARFATYRARFVVPSDRRRAVFEAALKACRARTLDHWRLPAAEQLDVKWDANAPGAWHRYHGGGKSTLTINPAALEFVDSAIDLACHEGYPGHHAQFVLADRQLQHQDRSAAPIEETIALLRSPIAMLREGAANYAVDLAFSPDERARVERDVLFPIAGLDPAQGAGYARVRQRVRALEPAIVPILRDYHDGRLSASAAADRLEHRALVSSPRALLRFTDDLGAYVLGYTTAHDRIAAHIAARARNRHEDRWMVLREMLTELDAVAVLSSPVPAASTPSGTR